MTIMRITLRTFEFLTMVMIGLGVLASLSRWTEVRVAGYALLLMGSYFFYETGVERKRRRRKKAFYQRIGRIVMKGLEG